MNSDAAYFQNPIDRGEGAAPTKIELGYTVLNL